MSLRLVQLLALLAVCAMMLPAAAQESNVPRGSGALNLDTSNFLPESLLPRLIAVDESGRAVPASDEYPGMALNWSFASEDLTSTDGELHAVSRLDLTLRSDLMWADGQPVTAYDVFFTHFYWVNSALILNGVIGSQSSDYIRHPVAVIPTAADQLTLYFDQANCDGLEHFNLSLLPSHVYDPTFAEQVAETLSVKSALDAYQDWQEDINRYRYTYSDLPINEAALRLAPGIFRVTDADPDGTQYLTGGDLNITLTSAVDDDVNAFMSGQLDVLVNPPLDRRDDLLALPDVQLVEQVGRQWFALGFNAADSGDPQSAFDAETGEALDQGVNRFFTDVRVRRAIQMAINVDEMAEAATNGYYTRLTSDQLPYSWVFDSSIGSILESTPLEAGLLLDEAGWQDWNNNGIRECHGCGTAEEGANFTFTLSYLSDPVQAITVRIMTEQLNRLGIEVNTTVGGEADQYFDAYILAVYEGYPLAADRSDLFRQSEDVLFNGINATSRVDPELDAAFERAAQAPQCDYDTRAAALREASAIISENLYYVPLFAVNDLYAAQGAVEGFAPRQNDPYWNIADWVINR